MATVAQVLNMINRSTSVSLSMYEVNPSVTNNDFSTYNDFITNNYFNDYSVSTTTHHLENYVTHSQAMTTVNAITAAAASVSDPSSTSQEEATNKASDGSKILSSMFKMAQTIGKELVSSGREFLKESVEAANTRIEAEQRLFSAMGKSNGVREQGVQLVRDYAAELEKTTAIAADVGISGMAQLATYIEEPEQVKALGDSLYNLTAKMHGTKASSEQMMGVADIMGQALQGQTDALTNNGFALTEQQENILKYGTEAEKTAALVSLLEGEVGGLAQAMANTPEGQLASLQNSWKDIQTTIGLGVLPLISQFLEMIQSNMPFVKDVFMNVFHEIFGIMEQLLHYAENVVNFFVQNWSWIGPVILGVVAALGALLLITQGVALATKFATIAQAALNMVMKLNPFTLVISLLAGLIAFLVSLWQTNDEFAAGLMGVWNNILNFFDQVPIFFLNVWNNIVNGITDMRVSILEEFDQLINGIIDKINGLLSMSNLLFNTSFDMIGHVDFAAQEAAKADITRQQREKKIREIEDKATKKALERDEKITDMLEDRAAKRAKKDAERKERFSFPDPYSYGEGGTGTVGQGWTIQSPPDDLGDIGKVGEVGKIRDTVDISSEDIKMMRELAEMKNIQNFVSLTPSVSVQTGDITSGHDIDTIVKRITTTLETEIAAGAKGVWKV